MRLKRDLVFIKNDFNSKADVIDFLGDKLVEAGAVEAEYVAAMHKREQDIGTYITEGVAIPHGTEESRSLVKRPELIVLKIPQGIDWSDGNQVVLAFGIAGNNEEHVELLGGLATLLMDDEQKAKLMSAASEDELFNYLDGHLLG
ncbi:mannitol-specific phosphotransferase enzyme IIA component [Sporomusaceae bacterium FL31]|nr:mannitol-specific phosphotransferase enzyme IIA component [Sporomusaceae bacterium FL31]GCE33103.1 mannitol-specific phosphotransferase enzyme IIA component [Sporomusaceae bacterium]